MHTESKPVKEPVQPELLVQPLPVQFVLKGVLFLGESAEMENGSVETVTTESKPRSNNMWNLLKHWWEHKKLNSLCKRQEELVEAYYLLRQELVDLDIEIRKLKELV